MSKIPKPSSLPRPKSISRASDASSQAHDALLRLTWGNLHLMVEKRFAMTEETFKKQTAVARDKYITHLNFAIKSAKSLGEKYSQDDRGAALQSLAKKLELMAKAELPQPDSEFALASITNRVLESPIIEVKGPNHSARSVEVGFIDISCDVQIPECLSLADNLPYFLDKEEPDGSTRLLKNLWQDDDRMTLHQIQSTELNPPTWRMSKKHLTFWIDIRVSETAIGQLMRELKTLRELGPSNVHVFVVKNEFDQIEQEMLKHEGFSTISGEWLETLE